MDEFSDRYVIDEAASKRLPPRAQAAIRRSDQTNVIVKGLEMPYPTAQEIAALRHEFSILQKLANAAVAHGIELVRSGSRIALVLELAKGNSFDQIIAQGPPPLKKFLSLATAAARTLCTVHAAGIVHKDIKPHHLFFDESTGGVTLIDFGISSDIAQERLRPVEVDRLEGTLAYLSPEQTGRVNRSVDHRSDLYSLGICLQHLLTGRLPFASKDPLELVHAHIAKTPPAAHNQREGVPKSLSDLLAKLLRKAPEDRYQTAAGLLSDLEQIAALRRAGQAEQSLVLGVNDHGSQLHIPEKLYGRQGSIQRLHECFSRAAEGNTEMVIVEGTAGVGKSALVDELHCKLVRGGRFVAGKFDQYNRKVPYSGLAHACRELVRSYLAAPPEALQQWKEALTNVLGVNVRVVMEVVPELELALGQRPAVAPLPPAEAQNRFEHSFRRFVEVSASKASPLVLFLDDLQWADLASLAVLQVVLTSSAQHHLLFIGSYRSEDVDHTHPLSECLATLDRTRPIERIELQPLTTFDVQCLLEDALPKRAHESMQLAQVVVDKTSGNPFFVGQFLLQLARDKLLRYGPATGWQWDVTQLQESQATDNVVNLILNRLRAAPQATQSALRLAACIGHDFSLRTLAVIARKSPRELNEQLEGALAQGLICTLGPDHRVLVEMLRAQGGACPKELGYAFAHDRIQQAAYSLLDDSERNLAHLEVGRLLLAVAGASGPSDEELFPILAHLNAGVDLVEDDVERLKLSRLNLRAAKRASDASAHASALEHAQLALDLSGTDPWAVDADFAYSALLLCSQARYLMGNTQCALDCLKEISLRVDDKLQLVTARNLEVTILTRLGHFPAASAICVATAASLGLELPDPDDEAALGKAIGAAFGAYQSALGDREVASLAKLPAMDTPHQLALVNTLAGGIPSAFQWNPNLMVLLVLNATRIPLTDGTAPVSPFFYAQYGIVHSVVTNDYVRSHQFGLLGLELSEDERFAAARGGVHFIYATFLSPWVNPLRTSWQHFERGIRSGLDSGDQLHAAYCLGLGTVYRFYAGQPLVEIRQLLKTVSQSLDSMQDIINQMFCRVLDQTISCLEGKTSQFGKLDDDDFQEARFEGQAPPPVAALYGAHKAMLRYLAGDYEGAIDATEQFHPLPGLFYNADYVLYRGLACAALAVQRPLGSERERLVQTLKEAEETYSHWAECCPENFSHRYQLLLAETHALTDNPDRALTAYEQAIEEACAQGATPLLALSLERCGVFQHSRGRIRLANDYLGQAAEHYSRWGASAKSEHVAAQFPAACQSGIRATGWRTTHHATRVPAANQSRMETEVVAEGGLDLISAMRASSAIAGELKMDNLIEKLLRLVVENAGATRAVLLRQGDAGFCVAAAMEVEPPKVELGLAEDLERTDRLPIGVVRYCVRRQEAVVLDDASKDNRFGHDSFIALRKIRSIACLPLVHQGKTVAVIYLESNAAAGIFHAGRVQRLSFLAGHAAVALENAALYEEVRQAKLKLEEANETLERRVVERTAELSGRNADMRRVLDNVVQGLITVGMDEKIASERSLVVDEWFGPVEAGTEFSEFVRQFDPNYADAFWSGFGSLQDGFIPENVALDQLPLRLTRCERTYHCTYEPVRANGELAGLLIIVDDITESLAHAEEEAKQLEQLSICRWLGKDRSWLAKFFEEGQTLINSLANQQGNSDALKASLHTLKGNAGIMDLAVLEKICHEAETRLAAAESADVVLKPVASRWAELTAAMQLLGGHDATGRLEVPREELEAVIAELELGQPLQHAVATLRRWKLEPLELPLARLGEHARRLGVSLGKGEIEVQVHSGGLLFDPTRASNFWNALVHIVRNAIDHGIEGSAERQDTRKGRPRLTLTATRRDTDFQLEIEDDGRGIDWDRVRKLACERHLPSATHQDLVQAMLASELSTKQVVTKTSGRGVGMAAVGAEVLRLNGSIDAESQVNRGCLWRVVVPGAAVGLEQEAPASQRRQVPHAERRAV